jgi:hypothetical protein
LYKSESLGKAAFLVCYNVRSEQRLGQGVDYTFQRNFTKRFGQRP